MSDGFDKLTTCETKIVVTHNGGQAAVGIQRTDCDPVFFTVVGDLPAVFTELPKCLADAGAIWQVNPRYRKADLPAPMPAVTPTKTTTAATATNQQQSTNQKPMF